MKERKSGLVVPEDAPDEPPGLIPLKQAMESNPMRIMSKGVNVPGRVRRARRERNRVARASRKANRVS